MHSKSLALAPALRRAGAPAGALALVAAAALWPLRSPAATVAAFDFQDAAGDLELVADSLAGGLTAGPWNDAAGSLTGFSGVTGEALGARDWLSGNSFRLQLEIAAGSVLNLTGIRFEERASGSGPSTWSVSVGGQTLGAGATTSDFQPVDIGPLALTLAGPVEIRIHGGGASSNAGTWRIDDFELAGSVTPVPLPASLPLLAVGLTLCRWRRAPA